jgi:predicted HAD superfamily Cof-like phosphohydrolase
MIKGITKTLLEFQKMIKHEIPRSPRLLTRKELDLEVYMIRDELEEFEIAWTKNDLVNAAKEIHDVIYVACNTAIRMGLDVDAIFNEVHRSNMTKQNGGYNSAGKWQKGPDYEEPNLEKFILQKEAKNV